MYIVLSEFKQHITRTLVFSPPSNARASTNKTLYNIIRRSIACKYIPPQYINKISSSSVAPNHMRLVFYIYI